MAIDSNLLSNISPKKRIDSNRSKRKIPKAKTSKINPWDQIDEIEDLNVPLREKQVFITQPKLEKTLKSPQMIRKIKSKAIFEKKRSNFIATNDAIKKPTKNFTQIPNAVLEFLYSSNISQNECKFILLIVKETLGWGRDYCLLSKKDILEKSSITNNLIYKIRDSLSQNGIISYGKDESKNKNYYMLNSQFFNLKNEKSSNLKADSLPEVKDAALNEFLSLRKDTSKVREAEIKSISELNLIGKQYSEILSLAINLDEHGALDGSKCAKPFSYLASGTYDKVLERTTGKSLKVFDGSKIFNLICTVDTRKGLTDEIREELTLAEMDWIKSKGGLSALGNMDTDKLKFELRA